MKIIILTLSLIFIVSCGNDNKTVHYNDEHDKDGNNIQFDDLRWEDSKFPIIIQVPVEYEIEFDGKYKIAFENAVQTWNTALGFEALIIDFHGDDVSEWDGVGCHPLSKNNLPANCIKTMPLNKEDFLNDDLFSVSFPSGWVKNANSNVLALTSFSHYEKSKRIVHADVVFNTVQFEYSAELTGVAGKVDLESVFLHELGHFLGLNHVSISDDSSSIMNPSINKGQTKRVLSSGDISRIKERYCTEDSSSHCHPE